MGKVATCKKRVFWNLKIWKSEKKQSPLVQRGVQMESAGLRPAPRAKQARSACEPCGVAHGCGISHDSV